MHHCVLSIGLLGLAPPLIQTWSLEIPSPCTFATKYGARQCGQLSSMCQPCTMSPSLSLSLPHTSNCEAHGGKLVMFPSDWSISIHHSSNRGCLLVPCCHAHWLAAHISWIVYTSYALATNLLRPTQRSANPDIEVLSSPQSMLHNVVPVFRDGALGGCGSESTCARAELGTGCCSSGAQSVCDER